MERTTTDTRRSTREDTDQDQREGSKGHEHRETLDTLLTIEEEEDKLANAVFELFPNTKHKDGLVTESYFPKFYIEISDEYKVKLKSQLPYKLASADHEHVKHHIQQGLKQGLYRHPIPGERIITSPTFIKKEQIKKEQIKKEQIKEHGRPLMHGLWQTKRSDNVQRIPTHKCCQDETRSPS